MEADWEIEIGGNASVIEARWAAFVDLRREGGLALQLPEALELPALGRALVHLNSRDQPVWTSKCDVWLVTNREEFDADELDAPAEAASSAIACYIDLLPRSNQQWGSPASAATWCQRCCALLHAVTLRACRADLVVRRAFIAPDLWDHGITAYLTASGASVEKARAVLERALEALSSVICAHSTLQ